LSTAPPSWFPTEYLKQFDPRVSAALNDFEKSTDFANYFITYGYIYHQKQMLEDEHRMHSYYSAILRNAETHFKDKVVMDLGTGSANLAIWAAQAGARKVYAIEATGMARHARANVAANGFEGVIEVLQGRLEELPIPEEKCDVMVSEWMGYLLLREAMIDSVIWAREHWMKPDGVLFPSHARINFALAHLDETTKAMQDLTREMAGFDQFCDRTKRLFKLDMSCLREEFLREQKIYLMQSVVWKDLRADQILSKPVVALHIDMHTVTVEDIKHLKLRLSSLFTFPCVANALVGWFDVDFRGTNANPTHYPVTLSTSPIQGMSTHWGQQVFYLVPPVKGEAGATFEATMEMSRNRYNHRLLDFEMDYNVRNVDGSETEKHHQIYVLE